VKYDDEDAVAVIAKLRDREKAAKSMDLEFRKRPGATFDASGPGFDGVEVTGDPNVVLKCGQSQQSGRNLSQDARFGDIPGGSASVRTLTRDADSASVIAEFLSEKKPDGSAEVRSFTETRFTKNGLERTTASDFGFIGWIVAQLATE